MQALITRVRRALSHTRVVHEGSFPLYRMLLIGAAISAVAQLITNTVPSSVGANSPAWFDYLFSVSQLGASVVVVAALYVEDGSASNRVRLYVSLVTETIGLLIFQTVLAVYTVAVIIANGGPPTTVTTWMGIMFWVWAWGRLRNIRRAARDMEG